MSDQIYDWKETVLHLEIVLLNEILETKQHNRKQQS